MLAAARQRTRIEPYRAGKWEMKEIKGAVVVDALTCGTHTFCTDFVIITLSDPRLH